MFKVIFNNDNEHLIHAQDINYNINYQIGTSNNHSESLTCAITNADVESVNEFENVQITSMDIYDEEDQKITGLTFNTNFYMINGNMNFYDTQALFHITLSTVNTN